MRGAPAPDMFAVDRPSGGATTSWDAFGSQLPGFGEDQSNHQHSNHSRSISSSSHLNNPSLEMHVGGHNQHQQMKQRPSISNDSGQSSVFPTAVTSTLSRSTAATSLSRSTEATSRMKNTSRSKKHGGGGMRSGASSYDQSYEFQMSGGAGFSSHHGGDWMGGGPDHQSGVPGGGGIAEVLHESANEGASPSSAAKKKKKKKDKAAKKSNKKAAKAAAKHNETASQKAARKAMKKAKKQAEAAVGDLGEGGAAQAVRKEEAAGFTGPIRAGVELWVPASPFTAATVHTTASSGGRSSSSNPASTSHSGIQPEFAPILEGPHESPTDGQHHKMAARVEQPSPMAPHHHHQQQQHQQFHPPEASRQPAVDTGDFANFNNSGESTIDAFDDDVSALTFGGASQSTKIHMSSVAGDSYAKYKKPDRHGKPERYSRQERYSPPMPPVGAVAGGAPSGYPEPAYHHHQQQQQVAAAASQFAAPGVKAGSAKMAAATAQTYPQQQKFPPPSGGAKLAPDDFPHDSAMGAPKAGITKGGPKRSSLRNSQYERADDPGAVQMSSAPLGAPPLRSAMRRSTPPAASAGSSATSSRSSRRLAHVEPVGTIPAAMTVSDELVMAERIQTPFETSQNRHHHQKREEDSSPSRKCLIIGIVIAVLIIAGAAVGISLKNNDDGEAVSPSAAPSAMPTVNLNDYIETFGGVAGSAIEDSTSPQYRAIHWMANSDDIEDLNLEVLLQRYVVSTLYYALTELSNESELSNLESWMDPNTHECDWAYVVCAEDAVGARVINTLDLKGMGLDGSLPPDIGFLDYLESLQLGDNRIYGFIPTELARLTLLRDLNLERNDLVGTLPTELGDITTLTSLDLSHNILKNTIPDEIYQLTDLRVFDVSFNVLNGSFSERFADMEYLRVLNVRNNRLKSTLPPIFDRLTDLDELHYDYNFIFGEIPDQVDVLGKREVLTGSYNYLTGTIPSTVPPLGSPEYLQLTQDAENGVFRLKDATLSGNFHSGTIPIAVTALPTLRGLEFADNIFEGIISGFPGSGVEKLVYDNNFFNSTVPGFYAAGLKHFGVHGNMLKGPIPTSLVSLTSLEFLDVGGNPGIEGAVPTEFSSKLRSLNLADLSLEGTMPTTLGDLTDLEYLDLRRNGFFGPIPGSLRSLTSLKALLLGSNKLAGTLPVFLGTETTDLERLLLNDNVFRGKFPTELSNLSKLTEFAAHNNDNLSGSLEGVCPASSSLIAKSGVESIFIQVDCAVECDCCTVQNGDGSCETAS